jgi:hypothetical protein
MNPKSAADVRSALDSCTHFIRERTGLLVTHRVSRRGVPHLLVGTAPNVCSVCWFRSTRNYGVFYPWMDGPQTRLHSPNPAGVIDAIRTLTTQVDAPAQREGDRDE